MAVGPEPELVGMLDRHLLVEVLEKRGVDAGAVRARLAVHPHRICDRREQCLGAAHVLWPGRLARADVDVDQGDAELLALLPFEGPVSRIRIGALEVQNGPDAVSLHHAAQLPHGGLGGAEGVVRDAVEIEAEQVGEVVFLEHGVQPGKEPVLRGIQPESHGQRPRKRSQPRHRPSHDRSSTAAGYAPGMSIPCHTRRSGVRVLLPIRPFGIVEMPDEHMGDDVDADSAEHGWQ